MAGNGDDLFFFQGTLGQLTVTLINPYSSESLFIDEEKNINTGIYDGMGGTDTILFTNFGDAIFIVNQLNQQVVKDVEIFFAGDGGDVIQMAHGSITTGDITIFGGQGDDILWSNVGNDTIFGAGGHDIIDGGPGSDQLFGEDDNDRISGGSGNDTVDGGTGNDTLLGGDGADMYYAGDGNDQITDAADGDTDVIYLPFGITLANVTFTNVGNDLHMTVGSVGSIVIHGQFDSASSGIDTLIFSNNTTFDLRTLPHNDEPVAHDDDFTVNEDNVLNGNVLADNGHGADHDDDNDTLTVTAGTFATAHGSVVLAADGSFTYTPVADYHGTDSFTYTLLDGQGGSDTGLVNIVIAAVNDAPVAMDDDAIGDEDDVISGSVLANNGHGADSDSDGGTLSVVAGTFATAHGSITMLANGNFTYTAAAEYHGTDSFDYTLLDGQGGNDTGTINITVNAVNDAALAQDDDFAVNEDHALGGNVLLDNGHGADSDVDGDTLTVTPGIFATAHGSVVLAADGSFTYTPAADYHGMDSFTYTLLDGHGGNDIGTVTIAVASVNDAAVAQDDDFSGNEDGDINGNVLLDNGHGADSDLDGDTLNVAAGTFSTMHGSVVLAADGSFVYTPAANYFGADSFDYTLLDGHGGNDTGTVHLVVAAVNDDPVAQDDDFAGNEDQVITGNLLADNGHGVDNDADGDTLNVIAGTFATAHGSVTILANGDFTYTPHANYFGNDSFNYTLQDGQGGDDVDTVHITLHSVNDAPVAQDDDFTGYEDTPLLGNVLANNGHGVDSDIDGGTLSVVAATIATAHGTVSLLADGSFTYTAIAGYFGADSFDYTLLDGQGGSVTGHVNILIQNNDIIGTGGNNTLNGTNNADNILGLGGNDVLNGNGGNDTLNGGMGADLMNGGMGDDTFVYNADATWTGGFVAWNVGSISVAGTDIRVPITGMNRSYDQFNGGDGVDTIIMGSGNDAIFLHDDYSLRPDGTVDGRITGVEVFYAGDGDDVLDLTSWLWDDADNVTMYGGNGNDNLWSSTGDDYLYGEDGNDYLFGGGGDDYLDGGNGNDQLYGSVDHDIMIGGAGNDKFYAETGNDILVMGEGTDHAWGCGGSDQFVFNFLDNSVDKIQDFQTGAGGDVLNITDILQGYDPLTDVLSNFVQVVQHGANTDIKINADGDIGGAYTTIAMLQGVNTTLAAMVSGGNLVADHSVVV
ncbi:MAG: tandem-95 repeat protein [Alphaproteobacteria bacterium]|nr:tandem-95 repeat protein [Alphaproteobacteria bacterium]